MQLNDPHLTAELHEEIVQLRERNAELEQRNAQLEHEAAIGRTLMRHFPCGFTATFDTELRYTEVCWMSAPRGGLTREILVGRTLQESLPSDLCARLEPHYRAALQGTVGNVQIDFAGGVFDVHLLPLYNEHKQSIGGLVVAYDISEQVAAETQLRESEEKFRTLSASAQDAIVLIDGEGLIRFWNAAAERLLGYSSAEALGQDLHRLIVPEPLYEQYRQGMERFRASGQGVAIGQLAELEAVRKDGKLCPVEVSLSATYMNGEWYGIGILRDIAERRRMEAALRESEARLHSLMDHMPASVFLKDTELRYLVMNTYYERLLPIPREQALGRTNEAVIAELASLEMLGSAEDVQRIRQVLADWLEQDQRILATGTTIQAEDIVPIEGELRSFLSLKFPLYDTQGAIIGIGGVSTDITERRRMEEALRESEERYRMLVENINDAIFTLDPDGIFTYASPVFEHMTEYAPEEMVGQPFQKFIYPDDLPGLYESFLQTLQGQRHPYDFRVVAKDGHVISVRTNSRTIVEDGQVVGLTSVLADITERKQMEEALRESQALLRGFLDHSPAVMLAKNLQGQVILHNKQFQLFWGTEHTLLGTTSRQFFDSSQAGMLEAQDQHVLHTRQVIEKELAIPHGDELRTYIRVVFPIIDDEGHTYAIGSIATDISARKRAEEALQQANLDLTTWARKLELRNREITLLSNMSDLLQTCRTEQDASAVIAQVVPRMFPDMSGALYTIGASRVQAEAIIVWGSLRAQPVCQPDECWSLRRGKGHIAQDTAYGLVCTHLAEPLPHSTLCMPMIADGEILGMLHLCQEYGSFSESIQQLATTVAEHIALALANIRLRETLRYQAIRDPLTGLYNRRYMEESLARELQRAVRHGTSLAVVMLDLDHFKRFNDTFGHAAGDLLLRELGETLQLHLRQEDIACRYGGEEFTLIMLDVARDTVVRRTNQIREEVKHLSVIYHGFALGTVTLSLGIALFPEHGTDGEELLRMADRALYRAKARGRNRLMLADEVAVEK